jgi:hypothetical protein
VLFPCFTFICSITPPFDCNNTDSLSVLFLSWTPHPHHNNHTIARSNLERRKFTMSATRILVTAASKQLTTPRSKFTTSAPNAISEKPTQRISSNLATATSPKATTILPSQITPQPETIPNAKVQTLSAAIGTYIPMPNPKPAGVGEWTHGLIQSSLIVQCLLYGVQNPVERPSWIGGWLSGLGRGSRRWWG